MMMMVEFFFRLFHPSQTTRSWRITFYSHFQQRSGIACLGLLRDRYKESAHSAIAATVDMSEIVKHAATLAAVASRNFA